MPEDRILVQSCFDLRKDHTRSGLAGTLFSSKGFESQVVTIFPGNSTEIFEHVTKTRMIFVIDGYGFVQELNNGKVVTEHDIKPGFAVSIGPNIQYRIVASNITDLELLFVQDIKYNARLVVVDEDVIVADPNYEYRQRESEDPYLANIADTGVDRSKKARELLISAAIKKGTFPMKNQVTANTSPGNYDPATAANLKPIIPPEE